MIRIMSERESFTAPEAREKKTDRRKTRNRQVKARLPFLTMFLTLMDHIEDPGQIIYINLTWSRLLSAGAVSDGRAKGLSSQTADDSHTRHGHGDHRYNGILFLNLKGGLNKRQHVACHLGHHRDLGNIGSQFQHLFHPSQNSLP